MLRQNSARIRVRPQGCTLAPMMVAGPPPGVVRGACKGWTIQTTRRLRAWLHSVDPAQLTGHGYAVTLTVRDLPATSDVWRKMRDAWIRRVRRHGMIRLQWLTEWQVRGVPHSHMAIYFRHAITPVERENLLKDWLQICYRHGIVATKTAQDFKPISDAGGWSMYQAKHGARGVWNAQRKGKPVEWESTGRLWGKCGYWPTRSVECVMNHAAFFKLRRELVKVARADAKSERIEKVKRRRLKSLKIQFRASDPYRSAARGLSEWVNESAQYRLLEWVAQQPGCVVVSAEEFEYWDRQWDLALIFWGVGLQEYSRRLMAGIPPDVAIVLGLVDPATGELLI